VLAHNPANRLRTLATPQEIKGRSMTTPEQRLIRSQTLSRVVELPVRAAPAPLDLRETKILVEGAAPARFNELPSGLRPGLPHQREIGIIGAIFRPRRALRRFAIEMRALRKLDGRLLENLIAADFADEHVEIRGARDAEIHDPVKRRESRRQQVVDDRARLRLARSAAEEAGGGGNSDAGRQKGGQRKSYPDYA
jgi:hypothetical protein